MIRVESNVVLILIIQGKIWLSIFLSFHLFKTMNDLLNQQLVLWKQAQKQQFQQIKEKNFLKMQNSNLVDLMVQTKNYENHRKKIASIMNNSNSMTRTFDNRRIKAINTFYSNHHRASFYSNRAKQNLLEKQNDLILKKIIQVNNRKNNTLSKTKMNGQFSHNNLNNLKKSMQKINNTNQQLAQKLVRANSDLRQQKMSQSFRKHLERKQRIKKYEYDEEIGTIIPKQIKSLRKLRTIETMASTENATTSRYFQVQSRVTVEPPKN